MLEALMMLQIGILITMLIVIFNGNGKIKDAVNVLNVSMNNQLNTLNISMNNHLYHEVKKMVIQIEELRRKLDVQNREK